MMMSLLLASVAVVTLGAQTAGQAAPAGQGVGFDVQSGSGLSLQVGGTPVVRGSWFQYYEPGWTKGYYTSLYQSQDVKRLPDGDVSVAFRSPDGRAHGSQLYHRTEKGVKVSYEFCWEGETPVLVEVAGSMVWAPAVQAAKLTVDGQPQRSLMPQEYPSRPGWDERLYGRTGKEYAFEGPIGKLRAVGTGAPWVMFDARGYDQDWAATTDLFWMGVTALEVKRGAPARIELEWSCEPRPAGTGKAVPQELLSYGTPNAALPGSPMPMAPKPKEVKPGSGWYELGLKPKLNLPKGSAADGERFTRFLSGLWCGAEQGVGRVKGRVADLGLPAEGFELKVDAKGATVSGQDAEGLQHGLYALAMLARPLGGRLVVPQGTVRDWPTIAWRGVHMFVGPRGRAFHKELFEKALLPMRLNKAVLQCERTKWDSVPGIETEITMPREELVKEFEMLRGMRVEPIPLIQSFGHMEWVFANNKNLELAVDRNTPYAVDPRNPGTRTLLNALWDEAIRVLKPKTIHFGLDEVDMLGFPDDAELTTTLWEKQLPFLGEIATRHKVQMMLWGDKGLAPGEAIDAALGHTPEHAKRRRDAIPKGAWVADWHYAWNPDPTKYEPSLKIWKESGHWPIASTWYGPANIRGFNLAASKAGAGTLQTTWAGYEGAVKSMMDAYAQYSAYLLSAEYAWSGREEMPDKLGYDPGALLRRLVLDPPSEVKPRAGTMLTTGDPSTEREWGAVWFKPFGPQALRSVIEPGLETAPETLRFACDAKGSTLALAIDCVARMSDGEKVGEVEVELADGKTVVQPILYGHQVRAACDAGTVLDGERADKLTVIRVRLGQNVRVKRLQLRAANGYAGLRLHAATLW